MAAIREMSKNSPFFAFSLKKQKSCNTYGYRIFWNCRADSNCRPQTACFIVFICAFLRVGHDAGQRFFNSSMAEDRTLNMITQMAVQFVSS